MHECTYKKYILSRKKPCTTSEVKKSEQTQSVLVLPKHAAGICGKSVSVNFPHEGTMSLVQNFTFFSPNFTAEIQSGLCQLSLKGGGDKTVYLLELPLQGSEGK